MKNSATICLIVALALGVSSLVCADTHFADPTGTDTPPYTTPQTAAHNIQDAIDAASPGDRVCVAAGTYHEYLLINKDNLHICGAGVDQSIINLSGLTPYWHYGTCSSSYASRAGVYITGYGSPDEIVQDVNFIGFTVKNAGLYPPMTATGIHTGADDSAVLVDDTASWNPNQLVGQWVHNLGDRDSDYDPARSYGQITANTETTVTVTLSGGVENDWDDGDKYVITTYKHFYDQYDDGHDDVRGVSVANGKNILIKNCKVVNSGYGGITVGKARCTVLQQSEGITIDSCVSSDHPVVGISVGDYTGPVTITNNTCSNNKRPHLADPTREYSGYGIQLNGTSGSKTISGLISNNVCANNGFEGIVLAKYIDGIIVRNNTVTGHKFDQDGAGIFFYYWGHPERCKNIIIQNNTVTDNIRGIVAYYASDSAIKNNTITTDSGAFPAGQGAIKIDSSNNIEVRGNNISCDGTGISVVSWEGVSDSYDNTFVRNTISNAKFAGIFLSGDVHDNTFTGNIVAHTAILTRWQGQPNEETQGDGIFIDDDAGIDNVFHYNSIYGNADDGMENQVTTTTVNAEYNWWGDSSGPSGLGPGSGDSVSANVDYDPWSVALDVDDVTGTVNTGDPCPSPRDSAVYKTIQKAIDCALAGDIIRVTPGTYSESVTINKNHLTIVGDLNLHTAITGGLKLDTNLAGLTFENFSVSGNAVAGQNSIVRMYGAIRDLTIDSCVFDGESVPGRHGFTGGQLESDVAVRNSEFKNILGWAVLDSKSGSAGDGSHMGTVTFANNKIHDCEGSVVFRGLSTDWTDCVFVYGNTVTDIGDVATSSHWAGFEVNRAKYVEIYDNKISNVVENSWGEGQALQLWKLGAAEIYENTIENNYQGIAILNWPDSWDVSGVSIHHNMFLNNDQYGLSVDNGLTNGPVNAEYNWWGDVTGPYDAVGTIEVPPCCPQSPCGVCVPAADMVNADGLGDVVSENADYCPWMVLPTVMTEPATDIEMAAARLNGVIIDDGGDTCQYRFRYKKLYKAKAGAYSYTPWTGTVTTGDSFSEKITGLTPGCTYIFNAQARNLAGNGDWGNEETFTTSRIPFSGSGSGTEEDPYIITDVNELQEMNNGKCGWYVLGNDIDASVTLDWNNGAGFVPIGDSIDEFSGHLDGNDHTITNLYINRPSADYVGLFGYTYRSEIENVGLVGANITGGTWDVGGLVGHNHVATIANSYSTGSVHAVGMTTYYTGGLVGANAHGTILNCYSSADVSGGGLNFDHRYIGGLVGGNKDWDAKISRCYSTGNVGGGSEVGGLAGKNAASAEIEDSYSTATVNGTNYVGGLVGNNGASIENCYSAGVVTGTTDVGGLVGGNDGTCNNSFWDTEASGQTTSACGTGKTTVEMQTASTFTSVGWDFVEIWDICEAMNYPKLLWQIPIADFLCPDGVNMIDFAFFAAHWGQQNCDESNDYCDGTDFDMSGVVDANDLKIFADYWLAGIR